MSQVTETANGKQANGKAKAPTKADLQRQLAEALARAEKAEAALLAEPRTATPPPGGHSPVALLAPAEGVIRVWIMTDNDGYRLRLIHIGPEGCGWALQKWSDATTYHVHEVNGELHCDCPGGTAHGPHCNGGRGCKHARIIRAVRQVVDPGI